LRCLGKARFAMRRHSSARSRYLATIFMSQSGRVSPLALWCWHSVIAPSEIKTTHIRRHRSAGQIGKVSKTDNFSSACFRNSGPVHERSLIMARTQAGIQRAKAFLRPRKLNPKQRRLIAWGRGPRTPPWPRRGYRHAVRAMRRCRAAYSIIYPRDVLREGRRCVPRGRIQILLTAGAS
jgi:hypothetical protein